MCSDVAKVVDNRNTRPLSIPSVTGEELPSGFVRSEAEALFVSDPRPNVMKESATLIHGIDVPSLVKITYG